MKTAIVLVNLGTPDKPEKSAVKRYLREFLSDARVIEGSGPRRWLWLAVLNGIVLNTRPGKVAKLYSEIWDGDSPMRKILFEQAGELAQRLQDWYATPPSVYAAMTYGNPGISQCLEELSREGYQQVLVVPLFPQYSATSTAPVFDRVARFQLQTREVLDVRLVKAFYDYPAYIEALAKSVERHWQQHGRNQLLVMSYHGIPKQYADLGDPYPEHCRKTSELLAERLGLEPEQWQMTFQSRFGPTEWLKPYTDETLASLPGKGVKSVDICCPAFTADCLETLEEIAGENRDVFIEAGGENYRYITAVNAEAEFIDCLEGLVESQIAEWLGERLEN